MKHEILQLFLIDVRDKGSARIDRRKLAWMLGRTNLNASAYQLLLEEWGQIGGEPSDLLGFQSGDELTFSARPASAVTGWI